MSEDREPFTSATAVRMHRYGGPDVLDCETVDVPRPETGEVVIRHQAVGVNFADTYFRSGLYPSTLPSGLGVEGSGLIEAAGAGTRGFAVGDRVTYTGSPLGAYSTLRTMPIDSLISLPASIDFDTAAAMTMRGLTAAYLLRKIWPLSSGDTVLFHAAAGGVGLIFCQWAALLGIEVIGTVSNEQKAHAASTAGCTHVINLVTEDAAARIKAITAGRGVRVAYDGVGKDTFVTSLKSVSRRGLVVCLGTASGAVPPIEAPDLARRSTYVTRPALADYIADNGERDELSGELFDHVSSGRIKIEINHRYRLEDAVVAHRALESRSTTGSTIFDLR